MGHLGWGVGVSGSHGGIACLDPTAPSCASSSAGPSRSRRSGIDDPMNDGECVERAVAARGRALSLAPEANLEAESPDADLAG